MKLGPGSMKLELKREKVELKKVKPEVVEKHSENIGSLGFEGEDAERSC
jgi:hypothetical protein